MKTIATLLVTALLALSHSAGAQASGAPPAGAPTTGARAAPPGPAVRVEVDPRIELMSAVQVLTRYPLVTYQDFPYKRDVQAYFTPYAGHEAVRLFREMSRGDFAFSTVPEVFASLADPPGLAPRVPPGAETVRAAGGQAGYDRFLAAMRDFAAETRFMTFFDAHRGTYSLLAERVREHVSPAVAALEAYTGRPLSGAVVVVGPLLHDGGFAAQYQVGADSLEAYAFVGPVSTAGGLPDFGDAGRLGSLVTHEFAHLSVNPLTARHRAEVERGRALFAPMEKAMREQAYPTWEIAVNEHVVRAITIRLAYRERGDSAGRAELEENVRRGFAHLPALLERLGEYEADRARYPTLEAFYPRLLAVFSTAARGAGRSRPPRRRPPPPSGRRGRSGAGRGPPARRG
ncbi:MAG TPA: DUF4932 domain-containing protein [Longimicrobium sp.]|nr:DUF4932 domain-containing protein [Longimicrobium sp.]